MSKEQSKTSVVEPETMETEQNPTLRAVQAGGKKAVVRIFQRRHWILAAVGAVVLVFLIKAMLPMIPRTTKPTHYNVGDFQLEAITQVVGYRKLLGITESRNGTGQLMAASYRYQAGENPQQELETYLALLQENHDAVLDEEQPQPPAGGSVMKLTIPGPAPESRMLSMTITQTAEDYTIQLESFAKPQERPDITQEINITPQQAQDMLMTLTKADTGFTADISVYTTTLEEERAVVDQWEYYVFTVVADYSATRIEYRGTFYVGCYDGVILRFDKETGETSRLRGSMNAPVEESASATS